MKGKESCSEVIADNKGTGFRDSPLKPQSIQVQTRRFRPFFFRPVLSFGQKGTSVGMLNLPCCVAVNDRDELLCPTSGTTVSQYIVVTVPI